MENKKTADTSEVSKVEEKAQQPAAATEGASITRKDTKADEVPKTRTEETSVSQTEKAGETKTEKADKTETSSKEPETGAKAAEDTEEKKSGSTAEATETKSTEEQEGTKAGDSAGTAAAEGAAAAKTEPGEKATPPKEGAAAATENGAAAAQPEEKEKPNIVLSVLGILLCVILVPILALNVVLIVQGFTQDASVMPNIAGKFPLMVQSGSMSPTIEVGDLIIVQAPEKGQTFGVDDVVTFWDGAPGGPLVTHRIVEITTDDDGKTAYRTKGDANSAQDGTLIYDKDIVGTYVMRIPFLGDVAMFMQTIPGLIVCVILPLALFIVYDVIRRRKLSKSEQEETAALMEELERLRAEQKKN